MGSLTTLKAEIHNHVTTEYLKGSTKTEIKGISIQWKKPKGIISQKEREKRAKVEADSVIACLYGSN
jgi:hypothetical protein